MKKILIAATAAVLLTACGSKKTTTDAKTVATVEMTKEETTQASMVDGNLSGIATINDFQREPFNSWFIPRYEDYAPDPNTVSALNKELRDVEIRAYMGTWCGDSKRETPKFYKLLDMTAYDKDQLTLITVDRSKTKPVDLVSGYDINRVPTFIFYRDGKELGRFVEYPRETLEKDILKIVSGEDYKHSYED